MDRDLKNIMDTAVEKALMNRNVEVAIECIKEGLGDKLASKLSGLSFEEVIILRSQIILQ